jgi:hypothetical protein
MLSAWAAPGLRGFPLLALLARDALGFRCLLRSAFLVCAPRRFSLRTYPGLFRCLARRRLAQFSFQQREGSGKPVNVGIEAAMGNLDSLPACELLEAVGQIVGPGASSRHRRVWE